MMRGRPAFGVIGVDEALSREQAKGVLRRLGRMLRPWRAKMIGAGALIVGQTACLLAGPGAGGVRDRRGSSQG